MQREIRVISFLQVPPRQQTKNKELKEKGAAEPRVDNGASQESKPASPPMMRGRTFEVSSPDLKLHHNRLLDSFHTQVSYRNKNDV